MLQQPGLVFAAVLACVAGCQKAGSLPATYPVAGKVLFKSGQPLTEGAVQFTSAADPTIMATGIVASDGSFTLATMTDQKRVQGVIEGEHLVGVALPQGTDQVPPPPIRVSPTRYKVEPKDNHLTIEIEKL
jgi:hypothetical protein